jgi:hypothetical protein
LFAEKIDIIQRSVKSENSILNRIREPAELDLRHIAVSRNTRPDVDLKYRGHPVPAQSFKVDSTVTGCPRYDSHGDCFNKPLAASMVTSTSSWRRTAHE